MNHKMVNHVLFNAPVEITHALVTVAKKDNFIGPDHDLMMEAAEHIKESEFMIQELKKALYETRNQLKNIIESTNLEHQKAGYVLAMRLLQSDLELDDEEMLSCAEFTQPEIIQRVLKAMK